MSCICGACIAAWSFVCAIMMRFVADVAFGSLTGTTATTHILKPQIGQHKYPRRIHVRESLPTGPSGKVLKRVIVEELS